MLSHIEGRVKIELKFYNIKHEAVSIIQSSFGDEIMGPGCQSITDKRKLEINHECNLS